LPEGDRRTAGCHGEKEKRGGKETFLGRLLLEGKKKKKEVPGGGNFDRGTSAGSASKKKRGRARDGLSCH